LTVSSVHGNPRAKGLRAKIFADFIVDNLLQLDGTDRVLDVAGGKGQLSMALAALGIPCTVVDLLQRKQNSSGLRTTVKQLQRQKRPIPTFVTQPFPIMPLSSSSQEPCAMIQSLVDAHTCLVGLHPDQCTEAILDVALRHNKSVAIVPCCVFPSLFPMRMIPSINKLATDAEMKPVQTYDDFLVYLLCKDARLRRATLHFEGKNECIYMKTSRNETDS
jgi:Methyltransferase domain